MALKKKLLYYVYLLWIIIGPFEDSGVVVDQICIIILLLPQFSYTLIPWMNYLYFQVIQQDWKQMHK